MPKHLQTINLRCSTCPDEILILRAIHHIEPIGSYIDPSNGDKYLVFSDNKVTERILGDVRAIQNYVDCFLARRQQEQKGTAERVRNWYEIIGITLERLCNASESFRTGGYAARRDILLSIGCNPVLLDKSISIEPNPWLIPIKDNLPSLKSALSKVETVGSINKNKSSLDREQSLVSSWCRSSRKVYTL